jgi:DNA modification methylase
MGLGFPYEGYDDSRENLISLIRDVFPLINEISNNIFCLCGPTQIGLYPQPEWVSCVTWDTTGSFGKYGYNQWTPILCYGKDLPGFGNVNGVTKGDTLRITGGGGVGFMRSKEEKLHTCPKPLNLMKMVVTRFTQPTGTILDPFMGSGTTGVACVEMGRSFIGIEREPKYFDIACKRIALAVSEAKQNLFLPSQGEPVTQSEQRLAFE